MNSYIRKRVGKKGPRWTACFISKDADGTRVSESETFPTEREAKAWKAAMIDRERTTGVAKLSERTLNSFAKEWLDRIVTKKAETTEASYRELMRLYILPAIGKTKLSKVSPSLIQRSIVDAMEARDLSETTVRYAVTVLRICLGEAIAKKLLIENPASARNLTFRKTKKAVRRSMDSNEVQDFVEALQTDSFRTLYLFLLMTGLRPSEAFALRWASVDLDGRKITVDEDRGALRRAADGTPVFGPPKTLHSARTFTIGAAIVAELREHLMAATDKDPDALVFVSNAGTPLDRNNIRQRFNRIARRADVDGVTLYSLRHTFATLQLDQGVPVKVVSERLGHEKVEFTINTYNHVLDEQDEAAADTLDAVVNFRA